MQGTQSGYMQVFGRDHHGILNSDQTKGVPTFFETAFNLAADTVLLLL